MNPNDPYDKYRDGKHTHNEISRKRELEPGEKFNERRERDTRGSNVRREYRGTGDHRYHEKNSDRGSRGHRQGHRGQDGNDQRWDPRQAARGDHRGHGNRGLSRFTREDHYRSGKNLQEDADPDEGLSSKDIFDKYERRLVSSLRYPTINNYHITETQWGVIPKGFENVTSQRAKLSGLFPLPGAPRPVDITKLEGVLEDGTSAEVGVLVAKSKIDPLDAKNSCILLIDNVDFLILDHLKLVEYFNNYLRSADIKGTYLDNNIEKSRKTKDDKRLIIEFKTNVCATLALALDGKSISMSDLNFSLQMGPENPAVMSDRDPSTSKDLCLSIYRPGEYVAQCLPPYESSNEVKDEVIDSPRKLTLILTKDCEESRLVDALNEVAPLRAFQNVRKVGTKEPMGVAFVEFFIDAKTHPSTKAAIKHTMGLLEKVRRLPMVLEAKFACLKVTESNTVETSMQDCPIEMKTLKALVKNEYVPYHPKLRVIQLINIATVAELANDDVHNFIEQDIYLEASSYGKVLSLKIPKHVQESAPGVSQLATKGMGKVYVEFEDEKVALRALMGMAGRSYNDRTVLCAFYDHGDYVNGLL